MEHGFSSRYAKGDLRVDVNLYLAIHDMNEAWSDENRVSIEEQRHYFRLGEDGNTTHEDYLYEHLGLFDYGPDELDEALTEMERLAQVDESDLIGWNGEKL